MYAAIYDALMWPVEHLYLGRLRRELLAAARGRILEIGAGTGANLRFYGRDSCLVLSEPDREMLRRARRRAGPAGSASPAAMVVAAAERLVFADTSFDTVVSTLVLCTVADPAAALAEVRRVLRPGGAFLLLEHVRSSNAATARLQTRLTPAWQRIIRGCHLDRPTESGLLEAGFSLQSIERRMPVKLLPLVLIRALKA